MFDCFIGRVRCGTGLSAKFCKALLIFQSGQFLCDERGFVIPKYTKARAHKVSWVSAKFVAAKIPVLCSKFHALWISRSGARVQPQERSGPRVLLWTN